MGKPFRDLFGLVRSLHAHIAFFDGMDFVDIYADEAITGTQITKREDFQRLINDCMNGNIVMIITKSIS